MAGFFDMPPGEGPQDCFVGYWRRGPIGNQLVPKMETGVSPDFRYRPYGYLHDLELNVVIHVLIREHAILETWEQDGRPAQGLVYTPDDPGQQFLGLVAPGGIESPGAFLDICGPVVQDGQGLNGVIIDTVTPRTPEHLLPPDPIEITGELGRFTLPGIAQTWPKVGDYLVTSSLKYPTDEGYTWNQAWNQGTITTGALIRIYGYPTEIRGFQGIIPIEWTVLERGVPWTEEERDPWDVTLPEAPPLGADPDEPGPEMLQPPGTPNGNGGLKIPAGVQNLALASFVLFVLPGLLGESPQLPDTGDPWTMD